MIKLIQDLSIFSLLGLKDLPQEEKKQVMDEMESTIFGLVMERFKDSKSQEELENLLGSLSNLSEQSLKETYPDVQNFINQEVYIYKKNALIDQLSDEVSSKDPAFNAEQDQERVESATYLKSLLEDESRSKNNEEVETAWISYIDSLNSNLPENS